MKNPLLATVASILLLASCQAPPPAATESKADQAGQWQVARPRISAPRTGPVFNVANFGAKPNAGAPLTEALQRILDDCASHGGGVIQFPAGAYLTGSLVIGSNTTLQFDKGATLSGTDRAEDYPLVQSRWEGSTASCHRALLCAHNAQHIAIVGQGTISGNPTVARSRPPRYAEGRVIIQPRGTGSRGPCVIELVDCRDVRIEGVTLRQSGVWTTHPVNCEDLLYRNVTWETEGGNSDGIDADSSRRIWIDHCAFTNADDSIALKSGKGNEGRSWSPTEDVLITDCVFHRNRFAAVAFGSELSGGIRRVEIDRCTFESGMVWGIRLKTATGRGGFVEHVRVRDIKSAAGRFFQVLMNVNNPDPEPVPGPAGITRMEDIDIQGVQLSGGICAEVRGLPEKPVDGLRIHDVSGTSSGGVLISNAVDVDLADIHISGFGGPELSIYNARGRGLEAATTLTTQPSASEVPARPTTRRARPATQP